jgi:restriction system protein
MAVPDFQTLMLPLLELAGDGQQHTSAQAVELLAQRFQLSSEDRGQLLQNGQPRFNNRVGWATTYLKKAGLIQAVGRGRFELTDRGRDLLATKPDAINIAFLEGHFPEVAEFRKARPKTDGEDAPAGFSPDGTWNQREGVEERVRQMMEISIPDDPMRLPALTLPCRRDRKRGRGTQCRVVSPRHRQGTSPHDRPFVCLRSRPIENASERDRTGQR